METEILKYAYDDTGTMPENAAQNESHKVTKDTLFILPRGGCYYRTSLQVMHLDTNTELKEDIDYRVGNFYQLATMDVGSSIYATIFFIKPIEGNVGVSCQYIGGKYSIDVMGIADLLEQIGVKGDKILWDDIIKPDNGVAPTAHPHHTDDLKGTQDVVAALLEINKTLLSQTPGGGGGIDSAYLEERLNVRALQKPQAFTLETAQFDNRTVILSGHTQTDTITLPTGFTAKQSVTLVATANDCILQLENKDITQIHGATVDAQGQVTLTQGKAYVLTGLGTDEYLLRG